MPDSQNDDLGAGHDLSFGFGQTGPQSGGSADLPLPGRDVTGGFGATGPGGGDLAANLDLSSGYGATGASGSDSGIGQLSDAQATRLQVGTLLAGRYEVQGLLGLGGMGAVYRVRDWQRRKDIALKVMLPSLLSRPKAVMRFAHESELMLALAHPAIVRVFDIGNDDARGLRFFTMELLEGKSLREWLNEKKETGTPVEANEALAITGQLLEALRYAHGTTVHRDLKPENVFLVEGDTLKIKVLDFGIAKLQDGSQLTATSMAMGTAYYMAPEQQRDAASVDQRADLYSVSVMLYEMLTGKLPVGRFKTPAEERKALPRGLDALVLKGLEPEAKDRPETALVLLTEIRAIRDILARGPRRGGKRGALVAVGLLLLFAGSAAALYATGALDRWMGKAADLPANSAQPSPGPTDAVEVALGTEEARPAPEAGTEPTPSGEEAPEVPAPPAPPAPLAPLAIVELSPASGSVVRGLTVDVSGRVTGGGIQAIRVNGLTERLDDEGRFSLRLSVDEGENQLEVRAGEGERAAQSTIGFWVDNTAPGVEVMSPAEGLVTRAETVTLRVRVDDEHPGDVLVDDLAASRVADGVYERTLVLPADGKHEWRIVVRDVAGNQTQATRAVVRDTQAPTLEIKAPVQGALTNQARITVQAISRDANPQSVHVEGTLAKPIGGIYTAEIDLAEGPNAVNVVARDAVGHETRATVVVTRDAKPPTVRASVNATDSKERARLRVEADEVLSAIEIDGDRHAMNGPFFSVEVAVPEGGGTLKVRGFDRAGNVGVAQVVLPAWPKEDPIAVDVPVPASEGPPTTPAHPDKVREAEAESLGRLLKSTEAELADLEPRAQKIEEIHERYRQEIAAATATRDNAEKRLERVKILVQKGAASQQELEQANAALREAAMKQDRFVARFARIDAEYNEVQGQRKRLEAERETVAARIEANIAASEAGLPEAERNLRAGKRYLAWNATRRGVVTLPSGVQITKTREGTGKTPSTTSTVRVDYSIVTINGTVMDRSQAGAPATFPMNGIIPGLAEGLSQLREGGRARIAIPSELAYGARGTGRIRPNLVLIAHVELVEVQDK